MKTLSNLLALSDNATVKQLTSQLKGRSQVYFFNPFHIEPINDWKQKINLDWQTIEKIIVVSAYAVRYGLSVIKNDLAESVMIFSIGAMTAATVESLGFKKVIYPKRYHSESLLALDGLQKLQDQKLLIFKGIGGRDLLEKSALERGAKVYSIDCYSRTLIIKDLTESLKIWQNHSVQILLVSSAESLHAFARQVPHDWQMWLKQLTLIVTSERLEKIARDYGFNKIKCAEHFTAHAIYRHLKDIL